MRSVVARIVALLAAFFAMPSQGGTVTLFRSSSEFLAAAPIESMTTFDNASYSTYSTLTTFDDIQYQLLGVTTCIGGPHDTPQPCWQTKYGGELINGSPNDWPAASVPNHLIATVIAEQRLSFGNGGSVAAVGFAFATPGHHPLFPWNPVDGWEIVVNEVDGALHTYFVSGQEALDSPVPLYFGFLSSSGIREILIHEVLLTSPYAANWGYDDVARSAVVPNPDPDGDGVPAAIDNCTLVGNSNQIDADSDNYGNRCDGDLNNNGVTNAQDYAIFRSKLGSHDPVADLNSNGTVNVQDYATFRTLLGSPPGPSGLCAASPAMPCTPP